MKMIIMIQTNDNKHNHDNMKALDIFPANASARFLVGLCLGKPV